MQTSSPLSMLRVRFARGPGLAVYLMVVAIFGVLVPWMRGLGFLDPVILIAYTCLGGVFAGPAAVQLFDSVPTSVREALGRVTAAVVFGEVVVVILVALGLGTVRLAHRGIFPLEVPVLIAGLVLGAALSLAMAAMAAWIRSSYSASVARAALRATFVALLMAFFFRSEWLPDVAWMGAAAAFVVAILFMLLLARRVSALRVPA